MQISSKVEYEFTLKLNLIDAQRLVGVLAADGGYECTLSEMYDALLTELRNLNVDPF
jgi:hypothetical protein